MSGDWEQEIRIIRQNNSIIKNEINRVKKQPLPFIILFTFLLRPDFVVGIPVNFEILRFAEVIPVALFQEIFFHNKSLLIYITLL